MSLVTPYSLIDRAILGPLANNLNTSSNPYPSNDSFTTAVQMTDMEAIQLVAIWNSLFKGSPLYTATARDQVHTALGARGQAAATVQYSQGDRILLQQALARIQVQINYPVGNSVAPYDMVWQGRTFQKGSNVPLDAAQALGLS